MNDFLNRIAVILEAEELKESDDLKSFPQWDSLSVLSVIAMLDSSYGVSLHANDLKDVGTAGDLWKLVESRKSS